MNFEVLLRTILLKKQETPFWQLGFEPPSHHIHLEKNIPISSGLGGGSSDVAAYLRCLADMMALSPSEKHHLFCLAGGLGADVPVCLRPGYQIMRGIGTDVSPARIKEGPLYCALANPGQAVLTASVFMCFMKKIICPV